MTIRIAMLILTLGINAGAWSQNGNRGYVLFDEGWRFHRGETSAASATNFDDANWRIVDLPHDWSMEDLPGTTSPFHPEAISGVSGGFTTGGTAWYRKTFTPPLTSKNKRVYIQFDGVYMNSDIWLNGEHIGKHPYGYTSFWFDITDKLKAGTKNTLSVQVKNEGRNSRWYSGSGIYRHVWLRTTQPVHIAPWGTYITTPEIQSSAATVNLETTLINRANNASGVVLVTRILDAKGKAVARTTAEQNLRPGSSSKFSRETVVRSPELWSVDRPYLYTLIEEVYVNKRLQERAETKFGIRSLSFDAVNGFRLNGNPLKLKGGCVHHDNGPLGARAYDRAEERRVALLKASGYNAIRTAHNPPSPAFLDACDRLGMLVIDEAFDTWKDRKNRQDYNLYFEEWWQKDVENMVLRDRNHPCVIMWSTGNEIPNRDKPEVVAVSRQLADFIRNLDPTRPVTNGVNGVEPNKDPLFATLDVAGYNYALDKYESEHLRKPERVVYASESFAPESFEYWMAVRDFPWVIGDFVWTAFDHIGEASIGWLGYPQNKNFFPWNLAYVGDIDICGWKRPQSYYRDALWKKDQLSIFVKAPVPTFPETNPKPEPWSKWNYPDVVADWNWKGHERKPLEVTVYSSCEEVELFMDGKSIGKKPTSRASRFMAGWSVPWQPGVLRAVGYTNGKQVAVSSLETARDPVGIKLSVDRHVIKADNQDLSYVTVELVDAKGVKYPKGENQVSFRLEGPGTIVATGNANPKSIESNQKPERKAWQGRCLVIIKSGKKPGKIILTATAEGMKPARVSIASRG